MKEEFIYVVTSGFYTVIEGVFTDKKQMKAKVKALVNDRNKLVGIDAYLPNTTEPVWSRGCTDVSGNNLKGNQNDS